MNDGSTRRPLALVVARARGNVIGRSGQMPWHHSEDLKHFKAVTLGHAVIMGRKTHESIGRPLPKRRNIVVTRNAHAHYEGCEIAHDLASAIAMAREDDEQPCIIGGAELYRQALPLVTVMYLTEIPDEVEGDTFFPAFDDSEWKEIERDERAGLVFRTLRREAID